MSVTMSLAGTFDGNDFAEVLELLSRRSCTGRFQVRAPSLNASIHLVEGRAVGVDIVVAGWREGKHDLRGELEEVCLHAIRSARGSFEFQPSDGSDSLPDDGGIGLNEVMEAARGRQLAWQEIESIIPTLSAVPVLAETLQADTVTVDPEQWRVIATIDGRRSVSGLARRLDIEPLHLCQILEPLIKNGAIEVVGAEGRPKVAAEITRVSIDPVPYMEPEAALGEGADGDDGHGRSSADLPAFRVVSRGTKPALGAAPAS